MLHCSHNRAVDLQADLKLDYKANLERYPLYQQYLRLHRPPLLAIWGKNDSFFIPPGAEAFKRDVPNAAVEFLDQIPTAPTIKKAIKIRVILRGLWGKPLGMGGFMLLIRPPAGTIDPRTVGGSGGRAPSEARACCGPRR